MKLSGKNVLRCIYSLKLTLKLTNIPLPPSLDQSLRGAVTMQRKAPEVWLGWSMVYAFLVHTLNPGPCRVLFSSVFVHEHIVSILSSILAWFKFILSRIRAVINSTGESAGLIENIGLDSSNCLCTSSAQPTQIGWASRFITCCTQFKMRVIFNWNFIVKMAAIQ